MSKSLLVLISFLVWSVGCTSMSQQVATNIPPAQYKELGEADCKKCSFLLLDVIPIKFDTMPKRAFNCAVEKMGGNDMVSTSVEESWYFIPFAGLIRCTKISGMVVQTK